MDETQKKIIYDEAKSHLKEVVKPILETKSRIDASIPRLRAELIKARGDDRDTKEILLYHHLETQKRMTQQHLSPYFVRCDVKFDDENEKSTLYFGKFPYTSEQIFSWVTPAAAIRFESPGRFTYTTPSGSKRQGNLLRKDQFMIVERKILFMSYESLQIARELIHQEYFSQKKTEFVLKDIVEQMEKAQDTIIRSHFYGSFLISGPAGSGKTTLALHRAAYLIQSPDTAALFPDKQTIIFVHDEMTQNYFSSLLPQLGIHKAMITTFSQWAMNILELSNREYVFRFGKTEEEKDGYEYAKNQALKSLQSKKISNDIYKTLGDVYRTYFSEEQKNLFLVQKQKGLIDRFDLTILLKLMLMERGGIYETAEKFVKLMNGKYVKKKVEQQIKYSLIVLDEAENYLSEQISVIKSTIDPKTNGVIYVGDLVQRTLPFTITDWHEVNEIFKEDRKITLQKVYRNTKEILEYIARNGYSVNIPEGLKSGKSVQEYTTATKDGEIKKISELIDGQSTSVIGILAKSEESLVDIKKKFSPQKNVHFLTINEAQGVEFDTVLLVGITEQNFSVENMPEHLKFERKRVNKDLLYVAMTRAMNELYILGNTSLKELLK